MSCLAILVALAAPALAQDDCVVVAALHWPGHDLSHAQVRVFRDKERRDLVAAFPSGDPSGKVLMTLAPGTYYLSAVVDTNNDGKLNGGDGLGFYGVEDPNTQQPQPLEVKAAVGAVWLPISLVMGEDGKLSPTGVRRPEAQAPPERHRLSGAVTGGHGATTVIYLVPAGGDGQCFATAAGEGGAFELSFTSGEYYLFAIEDSNGTEGADPGDGCAVYGYTPEQGRAFPTTQLKSDLTDMQMPLQWRISDTALLKHVETEAEGPQMALQTLPAVVLGQVTGNGPEGSGVATAADNARFIGGTATAAASGGRFVLAMPAGVYYVSVVVRPEAKDAGWKPALPGDLIGFYGVTDLRKAHGPQPLALKPGEMVPAQVHLVGRLDAQLHPQPLSTEPGPPQ